MFKLSSVNSEEMVAIPKTKEDSSPNLESLLTLLNPRFPGRVVIIGIGNRFWGDDGAGPEFVTRLKKNWEVEDSHFNAHTHRFFIDAGESPEDWFIRIVDLRPEVILVVDAIDLQAEPGSIAILDAKALPESFLFSTHRLPLKSLLKLWGKSGSEALVLAIQPENLAFGEGLSPRVKRSIDHLITLLPKECSLCNQ